MNKTHTVCHKELSLKEFTAYLGRQSLNNLKEGTLKLWLSAMGWRYMIS